MPKKTMMSQRKLGIYRRNWRPPPRKKWVGTSAGAAPVTPNRRRQAWII